MGMFSMLETSGSALTAERQRAEIVAANMAIPIRRRLPKAVPTAARKSSSLVHECFLFSLR